MGNGNCSPQIWISPGSFDQQIADTTELHFRELMVWRKMKYSTLKKILKKKDSGWYIHNIFRLGFSRYLFLNFRFFHFFAEVWHNCRGAVWCLRYYEDCNTFSMTMAPYLKFLNVLGQTGIQKLNQDNFSKFCSVIFKSFFHNNRWQI